MTKPSILRATAASLFILGAAPLSSAADMNNATPPAAQPAPAGDQKGDPTPAPMPADKPMAPSDNMNPAPAATPAAPMQPAAPMSADAGAPPEAAQANTFAYFAAQTDMFEIQAAKLAETKSKNAGVKKFAKMMVADHTATSEKLKAIVEKSGGKMSDMTLDAKHQGMIDALNSAQDFDMTYIGQQVDGHKEAVAWFKTYASSGDNPRLKKFAAMVEPKIEKHLQHAEALQGGSTTMPNG